MKDAFDFVRWKSNIHNFKTVDLSKYDATKNEKFIKTIISLFFTGCGVDYNNLI